MNLIDLNFEVNMDYFGMIICHNQNKIAATYNIHHYIKDTNRF